MTAYPSEVYDPRTKANRNGVIYTPEKETIGYVEDVTKLDDEVVAVETELGANPKGAKADVATRLASFLEQKFIVKTADETVNNSDALQNDDTIVFVSGGSKTWNIDITIFFESGTVPDIKFQITGPSGATGRWSFIDNPINVTEVLGGVLTKDGAGSGNVRACHIKGLVFVGVVPGYVRLNWAQNTANASDTKVLAGSNIIATQLS